MRTCPKMLSLETCLPVHPLSRDSEEGDSCVDELKLETSLKAIPALPAVKSVARRARVML